MGKSISSRLFFFANLIGFDPLKTISFFQGISFYCRDLRKIKLQKINNTDFMFVAAYPVLGERFFHSGIMSGQYFHPDLLIASRIYNNKPEKHVDIGSRLDGFVAQGQTETVNDIIQ